MEALLETLLNAANLPEDLSDPEQGPLIAALAVTDEELREKIRAHLTDLSNLSEPDALWRIAAASTLEDPSLDTEIDATLDDATTIPTVLQALVRAGIDWEHPAIQDFIKGADSDDAQANFAAAWLFAAADPDEFQHLLQDLDSGEDILSQLRALTLAGDESDFDDLLEWRAELADELDPEDQSQLDGALATLDPSRYTRALLADDFDREWLGDDRPVADFLTHHGVNDWAESLALFRTVHDREAFELASAFATSASLTDLFDDVDDEDLDPADAARWMHDDPRRVAYQLAIGEEEELAVLLIEATLHETLLQRGIQPPPISGLPLSTATIDPDALADIFAALTDTNQIQIRVALIRTLTDLRRLITSGELSRKDATLIFDNLTTSRNDAVRQYVDSFDEDDAFGHHLDWGCRGIHHIHRQLHRPAAESLPVLAQGLFFGPVERASLYRAAIDALIYGHRKDD